LWKINVLLRGVISVVWEHLTLQVAG